MSDEQEADPVEETAADEPDDRETDDVDAQEPSTTDEEIDDGTNEEIDESDEADVDDGFENGDFIEIDYTIRTVEDGTVIDTTREDVAEEAEIDDEGIEFAPRTIVVGDGNVFRSVDEKLRGGTVGDTGTIEVPADEAFGEHDPDKVRTVSAEKIDEDDRYPGAQVRVDGEQGHIETIIGGRARVNFNHPLAGQDLEYEYEIVEEVTDREEKAAGMLAMYLQQTPTVWIQTDEVEEERIVEPDEADGEADEEADGEADEDADGEADEDEDDTEDEEPPEPETVTETVEKETLYIEATPMMNMNQQWMFQKQQIAQDLMRKLDLDRVIVQETIESPGGMMGGMGGLGGLGGLGGGDVEDVEAALEDVDIDADELAEELDE